jgi:hypothetical protein
MCRCIWGCGFRRICGFDGASGFRAWDWSFRTPVVSSSAQGSDSPQRHRGTEKIDGGIIPMLPIIGAYVRNSEREGLGIFPLDPGADAAPGWRFRGVSDQIALFWFRHCRARPGNEGARRSRVRANPIEYRSNDLRVLDDWTLKMAWQESNAGAVGNELCDLRASVVKILVSFSHENPGIHPLSAT